MEELRSILASLGELYHVTLAERWEHVRIRGFDPAESHRINGGLYSIGAFAGRGFNCFVTRPQLHRVFQMFDDGMGGGVGDRVILRVPARVIAERTFDLDRTQETIGLALRGIDVPDPMLFQSLLDEVGYVVCFDPVPPECIEFVAPVAGFHANPGDAADGGA